MKKKCAIATGFVILCLNGCATTAHVDKAELTKKEIARKYLYNVNKSDGIDDKEALIIAKSQVIFRGLNTEYYLERPEWVSGNNESWMIRFYPVNKTLGERFSDRSVLISVDKKDGRVTWQKEF